MQLKWIHYGNDNRIGWEVIIWIFLNHRKNYGSIYCAGLLVCAKSKGIGSLSKRGIGGKSSNYSNVVSNAAVL